LETTFPLTTDDYWQFTQFVTRRTPALRRAALLRMVILPLVLAVEFSVLHLTWLWFILLLVVLTAAWVSYLRWAMKKAAARTVQMRTGAVGMHTVRIGADGFRQQSTVMESFVRWEKIIEIAQSPHHIAFFMGPAFAFIVPLSAFPDAAQRGVFLETARAYWRSARDGSNPVLPAQSAAWPPPPQRMV
jgi:hypothetical protein